MCILDAGPGPPRCGSLRHLFRACMRWLPGRRGARRPRHCQRHIITIPSINREVITRDDPTPAVPAAPPAGQPDFGSLSYSRQYDVLFSQPLQVKKPVAKPSKDAQGEEPGSTRVLLSDVHAVGKKPLWARPWARTDVTYAVFMIAMHGLALLAPFTFSWSNVWLFAITYFVTGCLGITLSFHRQLSHKSFTTPKWLEYTLAYCGVLACQGDPTEWVSCHRYHHLHTDTPLDPHSPYEGFWWSHMGWLLDNKVRIVVVVST